MEIERKDGKAICRVSLPEPRDPILTLGTMLRGMSMDIVNECEPLRKRITSSVKTMRKELGYQEAPGIEKLLIEQILTNWVQATMIGLRSEANRNREHGIQTGEYLDRRYTEAHGRLQRSIEALARVRRLSVPKVQVNIAERQINL